MNIAAHDGLGRSYEQELYSDSTEEKYQLMEVYSMKTKGNKLFPFLAVASISLLVGIFTGTDTLVAADQAQMQPMMQQMGAMMTSTDNMPEGCATMINGAMHGGNMGAMMQDMMGSSQGMTQEEHESHHR